MTNLRKENKELRAKLAKETKKKESYKKRLQRLKHQGASPQTTARETLDQHSSTGTKKTLLFHKALVDSIKNKYKKAKGEKEKQLIARVVTGNSLLKQYRVQHLAQDALGFSKKRWKAPNPSGLAYQRKRNRRISPDLVNRVRSFFKRDDVSRMTTGKRQTITKNKNKMQKRFLQDSMKNLHLKFLSEEEHVISYSLFCRLRPFWIVHPTLSDRDTCMCKTHENLDFMLQKLQHLKVVNSGNAEALVREIACDTNKIECMYGDCTVCKDLSCPVSEEYSAESKVTFLQWAVVEKEHKNDPLSKSKVTLKQESETTQNELLEKFNDHLQRFKRHLFNIRHQFSHYRALKSQMKAHECLIHIDFSENYLCKYSAEIQAVHFGASHQQACLHTGVLYLSTTPQPISFCTISPSRQKGPAAIWQYMAPVFDYIQKHHPDITTVHFYSDGPCTQYKQRGNFFLFTTELFRRGFCAGTWNFFEASHGKGAPDGVGGALKRTADSLVSKGVDIPDAAVLFSELQKTGSKVQCFFVDEQTVDQAIAKMPQDLPAVPSTMRLHQVVTVAPGEMMYRNVSCICTTMQNLTCECFNPKPFTFKKQNMTSTEPSLLPQPQWQDPEVVGKWCVVRYEGDLYPGIVTDTSETHVEVRCMQKIGQNRYFWPAREDILWYLFEDIVCHIPPPKPVTGRHMEIDKETWAKLELALS